MKKNKILAGISLLLLGLFSFSCDLGLTGTKTQQTGSIKGRAVYENVSDSSGIFITLDKTDGLRAVTVANSTDRSIVGTGITISNGEYSFSNLEPGLYTVYASSNDSKERAVATNVEVTAGSDVSVADLKLTATGSISGTITVDKKTSGNEGFSVYVAGTSYGAVTDTAGNYTISGVPAGKKYQIIMMRGGLTFSLTELVEVKAGEIAKIENRNFTSEEIKSGITGEKGEKGDTGETGSDGVSIVWRGYAADSSEIKNPSVLDAYYNTTDGCSYIYDGTEWQILAKGGKDLVNTAKKDIYLENILMYNEYGPNYQNYITFLEDTSNLKKEDKVRIELKVVSEKDADLVFGLVDITEEAKNWNALSELQTISVKANQVTSAAFEQALISLPLGEGIKSTILYFKDSSATKNVKLVFTQFDVYINDEYIDTNPESLLKPEVVEEYISIDDKYNIEYSATDRGIRFVTKILSNTRYDNYSTNASITFSITENESGIELVRNWTKSANNWNTCETYYPFVEACKKYSFTVKANQSDYTLYKKTISVTATGGLGEFRIENKDDYDVELTKDRVIQITGKPEFTDNKNVNIVRQCTYYELWEADNDAWNWIYAQESWSDTTNGTLSLADNSDGLYKWRTLENFNAFMNGHKYRASARTLITVAGYQNNGQTYFNMNDQKHSVDDWGGEYEKIIVLWGDEGLENLPGQFIEVAEAGGEKYNVSIVNYGDRIYEPVVVPKLKDAVSSKFRGWYYEARNSQYEASFPLAITPDYYIDADGNMVCQEMNGEKYYSMVAVLPIIDAEFNVTIIDGTEELLKTTAFVTNVYVNGEYTLAEVPEKDGYVLEGLYSDKELLKPITKITKNNTTIYTKWRKNS